MINRLSSAAVARLRSVPRGTWVAAVAGAAVGWIAAATLTKAPMTTPVALGFVWCMFVGFALSLLMGVLLVRFDRHDERLTHLEVRAEYVADLPEVKAVDAAPAEPAPRYAKLRALAQWADNVTAPVMADPAAPAEPAPPAPRRPSPVPRPAGPPATPARRDDVDRKLDRFTFSEGHQR